MPSGNPKLTVDGPQLLKSSEAILVPQETIRIALQNFYNKLAGLPAEPWGKDQIGQKFFSMYTGQGDPTQRSGGYQLLLQSLADLIDGLGVMGEKTMAMASAFIKAENANTDIA